MTTFLRTGLHGREYAFDRQPSLQAVQREAFEDLAKELKHIAPEQKIWRGGW